MKTTLLLVSLLLASIGRAYAQQPDSTADSLIITRIVTSPPVNPMLTPADSARERARKENARRLRQTGKNNPAHPATLKPGQSSAVPAVKATEAQPAAEPSPSVLARDARRREEAARKAAEADKQREKTLYKRAKKGS